MKYGEKKWRKKGEKRGESSCPPWARSPEKRGKRGALRAHRSGKEKIKKGGGVAASSLLVPPHEHPA